ncbi:hypothetical protein HYT02_00655 [Candidatus Gottesmanbacteria bacterium]|nr:hypothetical protein [Candidatus Gottesmanbacteria bacterium]
MIKRTICFVFVLFFSLIFQAPAFADDNFDVAYDVTYRFSDNHNALVTQTVTLTNKTTNLFATQYQGSIYGTVVGEINGFDSTGPISVESEKTNDKETIITASLKEKTVGQGSFSSFSVNYTLSGLVSQNGRINEIAIPRPSKNQPVLGYKVTVIVPQSMGSVGFVKPKVKYQQTGSSYVFSFSTPQSLQGILVGIGTVAHYSFDITYHLSNHSYR